MDHGYPAQTGHGPPHPHAQTVPLWTCFAWSKQEAVISASAQLPQDEGGIAG